MLKIRKSISALLAVLMICSLALSAVVTTSAKDFSDISADNAFKTQIDMLSDIGVIKGTTETEFSPEEKVTREQMALLLYRLMTGKDNSGRVNTSPFTDLYEPSYNGAISWAYANGFILGTSAKTFEPKGGIMLQDALAMITRALGQTNDRTNAGYPWSYIDIGNRLGLMDALEDVSYEDTLTRAETAALLHNALTADYIITRTVSGATIPVVTTVLREVYGYEAGTAYVTATGSFALPGTATVIRNGYAEIDIVKENGELETAFVKASDLGIKDEADVLGDSFNVFYSINNKTGIATIIGAAEESSSKKVNSFTVGSGNSYVLIDGVRYNVVESYSSSTATNANELLVFAFDADETLAQITSNASLAEISGFFSLELIYDGGREIASRAVLTPLTLSELDITDSAINIAGSLKSSQLTGGFVNYQNAKDGDKVLYYFNEGAKRLVIEEKLNVISNVKVTRITANSAVIGGKTYQLGVPGTEFTAESVAEKLVIGESFDITVRGNSLIDASAAGTESIYASTYLIATSSATPMVHSGKVCYFITANIEGKSVSLYVTNPSVTVGEVYRYEINEGDILTLTAPEEEKFAQSGELKNIIASASSVSIAKNSNVYYTISGGESEVKFITDENTVIVVRNSNGIAYKKGAYSSVITVNDGAKVVSVMKDSAGSVETLRYLYISDGELGSALDSSSFVQILEKTAAEDVGGAAMTLYTVYNFKNGKIEELHSASASLSTGSIYLLNENGNITESTKSLESGSVTGYAGNTVTIGETTYTLASDVIISEIEVSAEGTFSTKSLTLSQLYGKNVSFVASGNTVSRIIVNN